MANKEMGFLNVGDDTYEVTDVEAREKLDDLNSGEWITGQTDTIPINQSIVIQNDLIKNFRFFTILLTVDTQIPNSHYIVIRLDKKMSGLLFANLRQTVYGKFESGAKEYVGIGIANFRQSSLGQTEDEIDTIEIGQIRFNIAMKVKIWGSNV